MNQAINTLRANGIPLTSSVKAVRHIKDTMENANEAVYRAKLAELVGEAYTAEGYNKTRLTYLYLVSLLIEQHKNGQEVPVIELLSEAEGKAFAFMDKNPWLNVYECASVDATESNGLHAQTATKRTKRNVGGKSKLELARESFQKHSHLKGKALNEAVAKDVGTTVKGANSLVYMVRKELKASK